MKMILCAHILIDDHRVFILWLGQRSWALFSLHERSDDEKVVLGSQKMRGINASIEL